MATPMLPFLEPNYKTYQYTCELCDYKGNKKSNFERHILSRKHKLAHNATQKELFKKYMCVCEKEFNHKSSLYRHKKKCKINSQNQDISLCEYIDSNNTKNMITDLMQENITIKELLYKQSEKLEQQHKELTDMLPKINAVKNIHNENTIIKNTNVKQNFNIQIFLNEKCKDALNMDEFINKIEVTLDQLDITKNNGLSEGLTNIILENINKLSLYERPMHCTDIKREILYIKNEDSWEKDKNKIKIKKALKDASGKQYKSLQKWTKENPDFKENDIKQEYFAKTVSAIGKPIDVVDGKVIKKLCSNIYVKDEIPA